MAITPPVADNDSGGVGLVSGVKGLAFQKICPDGGTDCECDLVDNFTTSCIGVRIAIQLEGPYSIDGSANTDDRAVELIATFRNVILDRNRYLTLTETEE